MFVKSKPLDFYLKIIFRNQIEWKKTESTLSNFSVEKLGENQDDTDIIDPNVPPPVREIS